MKTDIILAGVGGQGILSIATCIGLAALKENLYLKQSEVHGMSQRGGAVESHFRLSDKEIFSDLIPMGKADIILAVEPMESLRYLPWLSKDGIIVSNSTPFINIPNYPDTNDIISNVKKYNHVLIDADSIAKQVKSPRSTNIVMLGAASKFLNLKQESLEDAISQIFLAKGQEIIDQNIQAFRLGAQFANEYKQEQCPKNI